MKAKKDISQNHILWSTLAWIIGLILIFVIWTILSTTVYKQSGKLPSVNKCFQAFGELLSQVYNWSAIGIALGQAIACFLGAFLLSAGFAILSRYFKWIKYIMMPFVTIARAFPTAVLIVLIIVFLITVKPLVPITVAFFVIFPMMYEGINNAIDNVDGKRIEMATVFNVSKWEQFKNIYLPSSLPYIFSSFIAGFGLTFKIAIASQLVQNYITAQDIGYPSIGVLIGKAVTDGNYASVIAWGMVAILLSLIMELLIKEIGRICMPSKYKDQHLISAFFKKIGSKSKKENINDRI